MRQLIDRWGLREPILDLAERGAPIFGTCAGMIVLAGEIAGGEEPILPLLDVTVERNAFGRQLDSFEAELSRARSSATRRSTRVFIRAPIIERVGPDVDVLARSTTAGSSPSASATSSRPRSTPSSPARRASTGSSRRWPPSTTTRARAPAGARTRPVAHGAHDRSR